MALRFRRLEEFTIIEVAGPSPPSMPSRGSGRAAGWRARRPAAGQPSPGGQGVLRRSGQDLLQAPGSITGPGEPQTRQVLREVAAASRARR